MKQAIFLGDSLDALTQFPAEAKRESGYQINKIQEGLMPDDWKPVNTVGQGTYEIRIRTNLPKEHYRVFYVAKFDDAVYILHAFQKKTQKTAKPDIERGKAIYRQLMKDLQG